MFHNVVFFLWLGVVSHMPNPRAGRSPLLGCHCFPFTFFFFLDSPTNFCFSSESYHHSHKLVRLPCNFIVGKVVLKQVQEHTAKPWQHTG
jgi:hypothetical protein